MIVAVIPSRYEPGRLRALVDVIAPECDRVLILDNGHDGLTIDQSNVRIVPTVNGSIYHWWNQGIRLAKKAGATDIAVLNDDIHVLPGTLRLLAEALHSQDDIGVVYPDRHIHLERGLPARLDLTIDRDPVGSREMTGYAFMLRAELPVRFDEGYRWWYGDTQFDEDVRLAGFGVAQVNGLPIEHTSDAEADGWQRRPELQALTELDGQRWAVSHAEIRDGRWQATAGKSVRTVLLVPRRNDNDHRDKVWAWCRARWEREFPDWPIFEGHHTEGPFNRSAAINLAARDAGDWDVGVVIDSDVFLKVSQVASAVSRARDTGKVTWAHRRWRGLAEDATTRLLKDQTDFGPQFQRWDMDLLVERTNPLSWSCCVAIPRAVWDDMGGFDERFRGWGWEDMAFMSAVLGLHGYERIDGDVYHVWHPRSDERIVAGQPARTASSDYINNARLGRRYMVALRRDHHLNDVSPLVMTDAEVERDVANLKRDDARFGRMQQSGDLSRWEGWWPTLEELRDGARTATGGIDATISVVLRSGGEPDRWDERVGYLRQSLASLSDSVSGPIAQRIVYSDWGDERKAELAELVAPYGFYIVGPAKHLGYSGAMQALWRYIRKRAVGTYIFSVEDDFTYDRPVDLVPMIETLRDNPHLRQVALLRHAAYPREQEAGGVIESLRTPVELRNHRPFPFIEHRDHFTANPSLLRRSLVDVPWPSGLNSERRFGDAVLTDKRAVFAYWGSGEPWITHIGEVKAASAY